ncbi:MAG: very short patch repair endonuclease [Deltaproteobacteria bacterium]|nr:MAG: very short patch repair endonuclease [Deltaproteobacteria bacterium]
MARVRGRDTKPEVRLRKALWAEGLRYRIGTRVEGVRPDLAFIGPRVCVFVDGCFWHGCPHHYVRPRTREAFWAGKLRANNERDREQTRRLESRGWRVVRIWEHEVEQDLEGVVALVRAQLDGQATVVRQWRVVQVIPLDDGSRHERRLMELLRSPAEGFAYDGPRNSRTRMLPLELT